MHTLVEHKHGDAPLTSKMIDEKVFPFTPYSSTKKLYQVIDTGSNDNPNVSYVLASFGGVEILDADYHTWDNQEENQFYYLEGTGETIGGTCNFETVGSPNPSFDTEYGLWLDPTSEGGYIKYLFNGEKLTHFRCKFTGAYNTPAYSLGSIALSIKYLDGSTHSLAYISDSWQNPEQGQVIGVNGNYIEGTYDTYHNSWEQGPMEDFTNYQIDANVPLDKQEGIDYIYIQAYIFCTLHQ